MVPVPLQKILLASEQTQLSALAQYNESVFRLQAECQQATEKGVTALLKSSCEELQKQNQETMKAGAILLKGGLKAFIEGQSKNLKDVLKVDWDLSDAGRISNLTYLSPAASPMPSPMGSNGDDDEAMEDSKPSAQSSLFDTSTTSDAASNVRATTWSAGAAKSGEGASSFLASTPLAEESSVHAAKSKSANAGAAKSNTGAGAAKSSAANWSAGAANFSGKPSAGGVKSSAGVKSVVKSTVKKKRAAPSSGKPPLHTSGTGGNKRPRNMASTARSVEPSMSVKSKPSPSTNTKRELFKKRSPSSSPFTSRLPSGVKSPLRAGAKSPSATASPVRTTSPSTVGSTVVEPSRVLILGATTCRLGKKVKWNDSDRLTLPITASRLSARMESSEPSVRLRPRAAPWK